MVLTETPRREVSLPDRNHLAMFAGNTRVAIGAAQHDLGYQPRFDFADGMRLTGTWLQWFFDKGGS